MKTPSVAMSGRASLDHLHALDPMDIDALPWLPVKGCPGVHEKVLWRLGNFTQALIHLDHDAVTVGEPTLAAHEHIWVVSGAATIAGRRLIAGSYLHVPPGVRHAITEVDSEGCTLLQMHRPHAPVEAELLATQDESFEFDPVLPGEGIESAAAEALAAGFPAPVADA